jgi:prolyl 4-hydroxylase
MHALQGWEVEVLSQSPRVHYVKDLLSEAECQYLMSRAAPQLQRSLVVSEQKDNDQVEKLHEARTSHGMFLEHRGTDPVVRNIERRIAQLTQIPDSHTEAMQILRYDRGAEYRPHYDYFDPSTPGGLACYERGGQRVATLIIYLAAPIRGGETVFPRADLKVSPVAGDAVLFYNCTPEGKEDVQSLHGGAPVLEGEKWVAVKWFRKGVFH